MSTLGKAVIEYSADTARFIGDAGRAAAMFNRGMSRMEAGVQNLRNALVTAAGAGGLGLLIKRAIDSGDQLHKLAQKVGFSVESLSALKFGADLSDVSFEGLTRGLKEFNKSLTEANDENSKAAQIFKALGVDIRQGPDAALRQFADAFTRLEGQVKAPIAEAIMGKSGADLIPWLNQGASGMDEMAARARALGLVISADFAAQAERLNDNLKTLGMLTEALGVRLGGPVIEGLVSFTTALVKAAEGGNVLLGALKEIAKLDLALASLLPGPIGRLADVAAEIAFAPAGPGHAVTGKIRRPGAAAAAPNPEAVACAASGGRWVNGQCVRSGDKSDEMVARQWAEQMQEEARSMAEAAQAANDLRIAERARGRMTNIFGEVMGATTSDLERRLKLWMEAIDLEQEEAIRIGQLQAGFDGLGNAIATDTRLAEDLGFVFSSAFEDAILSGEKLRDLINSLGQDIARVLIRRTITEPLAGFITEGLKGITGSAVGGPVSPGGIHRVGEHGPELFVPQGFGSIVPAHEVGGGSVTVNVSLAVPSPDPRMAAGYIQASMPLIVDGIRREFNRRGVATALG
jgi:hypothetical protein